MFPNILVVSDNVELQQALAHLLDDNGLISRVASTVSEAEAILNHEPVSMVFCSDELPNAGIDRFVPPASEAATRPPVVVVSRFDDWKHYLQFMKRGVFDYVLYPLNGADVERIVKSALSPALFNKASHAAAAI
jgi:DNA-binding NtrC family response regulator